MQLTIFSAEAKMGGIETIPGGAPWVVWTAMTTGDLLTATLGFTALGLAAVGLGQMGAASTARNRQLDAMLTMIDDRTASLSRSMEVVIERTSPATTQAP